MKIMKKLAAILLSVCLVIPCFTQLVHAADGTLQFTDPEATQGKTVTVEGVVRSGGSPIGNISVTMTYDASALEFVSGDGVTGSGGTITYTSTGDGTQSEIRFDMKFNVLTAGDNVVKATESTATVSSGEALNLTLGTSTIKAAEGDGTTAYETPAGGEATTTEGTSKITVEDVEYDFSEAFPATDIPDGFEETTMNYDGADRKFVSNATSGVTLGYLVDASGKGAFFLYDSDTASFSPFVPLYISDTTTIVLLSDTKGVELPERYQSMQLTVNDHVFPAWQDMENDGFYVLYAIDGSGNKQLYQYENSDGTYQRFIAPTVEKKDANTGLLGKIKNFISDNFLLSVLIVIVVTMLLLILLIVILVKLHHRNVELDELYDEYNIPDEYEDNKKKSNPKKINNKQPKHVDKDHDDYYDEDFYDDNDDDNYDDDDYYDDDDFYDDDDNFDDDDYDDDDDYYNDEDDDETQSNSKKSKDEDYKIDFIDL